MPTSTQKGFSVGKWELNYLKGRYNSHRSKVAAAKPAIDSKAPAERPHVHYKRKKGLNEKQRQTLIMIENLRILNKTCEIMTGSDYNYYHHEPCSRENYNGKKMVPIPSKNTKRANSSSSTSKSNTIPSAHQNLKPKSATVGFHQQQLEQRQSQSITLIMKKNTHVMMRWFLRRFGKYVPWWAQITY